MILAALAHDERPSFFHNDEAPPGYVVAVPPQKLLNDVGDGTIPRPHYAGDSFRRYAGRYYFQAFPNSKVPTSSVFCIIIPAFVVVSAVGIMLLSRLFWSSTFKSENGVLADREKAFLNLRLVGAQDDDIQDLEKAASPSSPERGIEQISASPSESDTKDSEFGRRYTPEAGTTTLPASESTKMKAKDVNEISGPVVPMLRNDNDSVLSSECSDAEEEEELDELEHFNQQDQVPSEEAPAYEATTAIVAEEAPPAADAGSATDVLRAQPPIEGSAWLPAADGVPLTQPSDHNLNLFNKHTDQNSLLP